MNIDDLLRAQLAADKAEIIASVLADNGLDTPELLDAIRDDHMRAQAADRFEAEQSTAMPT
jgi:2-hydroxychromene-2-carboxylate isomerase